MQVVYGAVWYQLLEMARRTPSPHNVQPWRVRLRSAEEADLLIDGARVLPREDLTSAFLLSAMAMYEEALRIAARAVGMVLESTPLVTPERLAEMIRVARPVDLIPFVRLRLRADATPTSEERREAFLMSTRRTSRRGYTPRPIPWDAYLVLAAWAADNGQRYMQINENPQIDQFVGHDIGALFGDLNVAGYRHELTSWFRYDDNSAARTRDGLSVRCMNLSADLMYGAARTPCFLRFPPTRQFLKREYRRRLGTIPSIGILSGPFFKPDDAVKSGRFLLRFWLRLTDLGLSIHPFGNLVTNPKAARWIREQTGLPDAYFVFKIGYSDPPPESYRRHVEEVLV